MAVAVALVAGLASAGPVPIGAAGPSTGPAPLTGETRAATPGRGGDPVVLTGAALPTLRGRTPGEIVAFRWSGAAWQHVAVQVDERSMVDLGRIYGAPALGRTVLTYTDAGTFTGPDPDPSFDADDELVVRSADGGPRPPGFSEPTGVVTGSGVELSLTDPLGGGADAGSVFLFRRSGGLDPGAGRHDVDYSFSLLSGPYLSTYRTQDGPNPENSTVTAGSYRHHFSDRWLSDRLHVTVPGSSGVDILDRHKALFGPGICGRSEDTFNDAEGAFVANLEGPIRAIRSYIGANSGPYTQRTHVFYADREEIVTDLRVHTIPGVMDFFDYSPAAIGMRYANNRVAAGVTIDGNPDAVPTGPLAWELVDGPQGAIVTGHTLSSTAELDVGSWYEDDAASPTTQCTGDGDALGASGPRIEGTIPCTDVGCADRLRTVRRLLFQPPGVTPAAAASRATAAATPLAATVRPWVDRGSLERLVTAMYHDLLGRAPDDAGRAYWVDRLSHGESRAAVALALVRSSEGVGQVVRRLYQQALDRAPDAAGLTYWVGQVRAGRRTIDQVAAALYGADEGFEGGGITVEDRVSDLFLRILGRAAEPPAVEFWSERYEVIGPGGVALALHQSAESSRRRTAALYQRLLQRPPDPNGLAFWSSRTRGDGELTLAANLAGSSEYLTRAQSRTFD